jgi:ACS family tartrate transporter-like MFS transporter
MTGMLLAVPGSLALGTAVSAWLLRQDAFDLAGWQWLFLAEGAPAVLLGLALPFLMTDRPRDAKWLTSEERDWLERTLASERRETVREAGAVSLGAVLRLRTVWLLALGILATNIGGYGMVFWLPTVVKGFLGTTTTPDDSAVLLWTGPVYLCGIAGVLISGRSSDRTGERKWHCVAGQVGAATFLVASTIPGQSWAVVFIWLCLAGFFANFWYTPYWILPTTALTSSAAAVAVGFINMSANIAGLIGNATVGAMRKAEWSDAACLLFLAGGFIVGAVLVGLIRVRASDQAPA